MSWLRGTALALDASPSVSPKAPPQDFSACSAQTASQGPQLDLPPSPAPAPPRPHRLSAQQAGSGRPCSASARPPVRKALAQDFPLPRPLPPLPPHPRGIPSPLLRLPLQRQAPAASGPQGWGPVGCCVARPTAPAQGTLLLPRQAAALLGLPWTPAGLRLGPAAASRLRSPVRACACVCVHVCLRTCSGPAGGPRPGPAAWGARWVDVSWVIGSPSHLLNAALFFWLKTKILGTSAFRLLDPVP